MAKKSEASKKFSTPLKKFSALSYVLFMSIAYTKQTQETVRKLISCKSEEAPRVAINCTKKLESLKEFSTLLNNCVPFLYVLYVNSSHEADRKNCDKFKQSTKINF